MTTRARQIIARIEERLATITGSGWNTDAGERIYRGRENFHSDDDTFPLISIIEADEVVVSANMNHCEVELDVSVVGFIQGDPNNPLDAGHELYEDLMRALFPSDEYSATGMDRLGGLAKSFEYRGRLISPREDGGKTTSVEIRLSVNWVMKVSAPSL